jgi:hypothetical protein
VANPSFAVPAAPRELTAPEQQDTLAIVGAFYWAAERGVVRDFFSAYGRLMQAIGRTVSPDVPPTTQQHARPLVPLSATWGRNEAFFQNERLALAQFILGPALRNANALDANGHWLDADAHMKGLALAEATFQHALARSAWKDAADALADARDGDAEQCHRIADLRMIDANYYALLAEGNGWV